VQDRLVDHRRQLTDAVDEAAALTGGLKSK